MIHTFQQKINLRDNKNVIYLCITLKTTIHLSSVYKISSTTIRINKKPKHQFPFKKKWNICSICIHTLHPSTRSMAELHRAYKYPQFPDSSHSLCKTFFQKSQTKNRGKKIYWKIRVNKLSWRLGRLLWLCVI